MYIPLKPRPVRRMGPSSLYVILPPEFAFAAKVGPGTYLEPLIDPEKPAEMIIRKTTAPDKKNPKKGLKKAAR